MTSKKWDDIPAAIRDLYGSPRDYHIGCGELALAAADEIERLQRVVEQATRQVHCLVNHWNEFGPVDGLDEKMHWAGKWLDDHAILPATETTQAQDYAQALREIIAEADVEEVDPDDCREAIVKTAKDALSMPPAVKSSETAETPKRYRMDGDGYPIEDANGEWIRAEDWRPALKSHETDAVQDCTELARLFHNFYEELAPQYVYETRPETRTFDPQSPNGRLMIAVCTRLVTLGSMLPAEKSTSVLVKNGYCTDCGGTNVHYDHCLSRRGARVVAVPPQKSTPVHVDPTGTTREPPHCPTCGCGQTDRHHGGTTVEEREKSTPTQEWLDHSQGLTGLQYDEHGERLPEENGDEQR